MSGQTMARAAVTAIAVVITVSGCGDLRGERELISETGASYGAEEIAAVEARSTVPLGAVEPAPVGLVTPTIAVDESAVMPAAFRFSATLIDGGTVSGEELYDGTPTLMTFVQPTCPISNEEGPKLSDAAGRHGDIRFVVVHSGGSHDDYADMIDTSGLAAENVVHIDDSDLRLWERFGVDASPSSVLIDGSGLVRSSYGALGDDGLDRAATLLTTGF